MPKHVYRNFRGLVTNPNQLEVGDGSLALANNISLVRPGVIQPRKGFDLHSTFAGGSFGTHIFEYRNTVWAHTNDAGSDLRIQKLAGGVWSEIVGYNIADPDTDFGLDTAETNETTYMVESMGIRKIEQSSDDPVFAGVPRCPDIDRSGCTLTINVSGVLPTAMQRAYRALVFYKRPNDNAELEGGPSGRTVLSNTSGSNVIPVVQVRLPKMASTDTTPLTTDYWLRVYASAMSATGIQPFEDFAVIYEAQLTAAQITAGFVNVTDITPDELRGQALYTNPSQQGIGQMNLVPPYAKCIAQYKGALLLGNVHYQPQMEIQVLVVDGTAGILDGDTFSVADDLGNTFTVTARTAPALTTDYKLDITGTASENVINTTQFLVSAINRHASNTFCYAYYMGNPSDPRSVGKFLLVTRSFSGAIILPYVGVGDNYLCFEPALPQGAFSTAVSSPDDTFANGWAMSKVSQGDAFPPVLSGRLGPGELVRIVTTNEAAFWFHSLGEVWIMTGEPPVNGLGGSLRMERWRSELTLIAPESARVMDGKLFALSDRGVVEITTSGYSVISDTIQPTLEDALSNCANPFTDCWAFVHPVDRRYCLGVLSDDAWIFFTYQADSGSWVTMTRDFDCATWSHRERRLYIVNNSNVYLENIATSPTPYADDGTAIDAAWALPPFTAGDGSTPCQLREVQVIVEDDSPAAMNMTVDTEIAVASNAMTNQNSKVFRGTVPRVAQRALRHDISLAVSSDAIWNVGGMALLLQKYQERGTK